MRSGTLRPLQRLWRSVDPTNLVDTIGPFSDATVPLLQAGHRRSATAALAYVEELRRAERAEGLLGLFAGLVPADEGLIAGLVRGAALAGIVGARRRGFSAEAAARRGFVRMTGTASRVVMGGGREVLAETVESDPRVVGWMRVTGSQPCPWCAHLAARGPMRRGDAGAGEIHAFHDHDACTIEPVYADAAFEDRSQWPEPSRRLRDLWDEATGGADFEAGGALEAFRRGMEAHAKGRPLPKVDPTIGIEEF
ncbi:MAG: hypothetical protein ACODAE_05550 [Gemmatimonadota bacterium]